MGNGSGEVMSLSNATTAVSALNALDDEDVGLASLLMGDSMCVVVC